MKTKLGEYANNDEGQWMLRVLDQVYSVAGFYDVTPIDSLRRNPKTHALVVDRKRDFGGCGKDAMKLEVNVPVAVWLQEMNAKKERCAFCDDTATSFDIAPVCGDCSAEL